MKRHTVISMKDNSFLIMVFKRLLSGIDDDDDYDDDDNDNV